MFYNHRYLSAGFPRQREYGFVFPFGHGMSYTTFEYRAITVDASEVAAAGTVQVQVEVANTGDRFGEEVVQLYARLRRRGVTRPVRELVGFHRVALDAGEAATVAFALEPGILAYYDIDMNLVVTPGAVELMAGPSSAWLPLSTTFAITGEPVILATRTAHLTPSSIVSS